jgi:hypothetical protein
MAHIMSCVDTVLCSLRVCYSGSKCCFTVQLSTNPFSAFFTAHIEAVQRSSSNTERQELTLFFYDSCTSCVNPVSTERGCTCIAVIIRVSYFGDPRLES